MHDDPSTHNPLDTLLEAGLQSYTEVAPSPDLAGRILRRAQQVPVPQACSRNWLWAWSLAVPALAMLIAAILLVNHPATPRLPAHAVQALTPPAPTVLTPSPVQHQNPGRPVRAAAHHRVATRAAHPSLIATSGPRPLHTTYSPQELALLNFVEQHPDDARQVLEAREHELEPLQPKPLTIAPLHIAPLSEETPN